ncbi:hypothetical protein MPDQ_006590 [Monascus purpureus]|uniref:Pathogenesis associated protein Cap20 n=1 Tax=Monascus purpureus TaxID=5098 RepID=A0A507R2A2_MONPU|nr:hypothetical protein MPDQ_006590 [Monascus purpureus]BDD60698.1 hypothetical protein MAP00_005797 [Monascus purpureus]
MGEPTVNGDKVHSQFLDHLSSYPFVSDSIAIFKGNKYGAKSLEYADQGLNLAKPVFPYLSKPYAYIAPYVAKADTLGDQGLSKIDTRFPFVKENTEKVKGVVYDNAYLPVKIVSDVRQHIWDVYSEAYKNSGGGGVVASSKALITAGFVLSQESLAWLGSFLQTRKEQARNAVNEKTSS